MNPCLKGLVCSGVVLLSDAVSAWTIPVSEAVLSGNVEKTPQYGAIIRSGGTCSIGKAGAGPDVIFNIRVPSPGLYKLVSVTSIDKTCLERMRHAKSKYDSVPAQFQIDDRRPTLRYVVVPWVRLPEYCDLGLGKFYFNGKDQQLKIWLPEHCGLKSIQLTRFCPSVPEEAKNYVPPYLPPKSHPRLWLRGEDLPKIRKNLTSPENLPYWEHLQQDAARPFKTDFDPSREIHHNAELEKAAHRKAFFYLMTGDQKAGKEAVSLIRQYMELVEFGNLLDITREIGRAIHTSACIYDWCYDLMTREDKNSLRKNMLRLALDMECTWPPFAQNIVSGHGNELQITRDLLAMAIAVYNEDPEPYKYCSYQVLERLVPMRRFDYRSPRHSQGVSYGGFRFPCDLRSALLFRQMLGREVFDENIKHVPIYWFYMQLPGDTGLRDGDGTSFTSSLPNLLFLGSAYTGDPLYKGEFFRLLSATPTGRHEDPLPFLILNDPGLKPEYSRDTLPLAIDFGPVLSGMVIRTGWDLGKESRDVVAEIKGGGFNFGGHQHPDAGSFQIWYKGFLAAKIGNYRFYGTPYDVNFNKRSVSQPMMLVRDPQETFPRCSTNDGGSRIMADSRTPEQAEKESRCGRKLYCSFGPSEKRPLYGSYAAELAEAYGSKLTSFVRTFHFFNLEDVKIPAVILMTDDITSRDPSFRKYWQINTLEPPRLTADGAVLKSPGGGTLHLSMPVPAKKTAQLLSGKEVYNVFGVQLEPPPGKLPEAAGRRILFSPEKAQAHDRFLVIMQIADAKTPPLKVRHAETEKMYVVHFKDWCAVLNKNAALLNSAFEFSSEVRGRILVAGLAAGSWTVTGPDGISRTEVCDGKNTVFLTGTAGKYRFEPGGNR